LVKWWVVNWLNTHYRPITTHQFLCGFCKLSNKQAYLALGADQEEGFSASGNGSWSKRFPLAGVFPKKILSAKSTSVRQSSSF
jgi:hypothetical protein